MVLIIQLFMMIQVSLSSKPIMGWSTWESLAKSVSEEAILENVKILEDSGLKSSGYTMIQIDDGWFMMDRPTQWVARENYMVKPINNKGPKKGPGPGLVGNGPPGCLIPDPIKFPRGMKVLGDELKMRGFKWGLYTSGELFFCDSNPKINFGYASAPYSKLREIDAKCFIEWGVNLMKIDFCRAPRRRRAGYEGSIISWWRNYLPSDIMVYNSRYGCMARTSCGNVYGCPLLVNPRSNPVEGYCQHSSELFRTGPDMKPFWDHILSGISTRFGRGGISKPGAWADPDYLLPHPTLSFQERRAQFGMWCIVSAPLLISVDLRNTDPATIKMLQNPIAIRVNQQYFGDAGDFLYRSGSLLVLRKILKDQVAVIAVNMGRGYGSDTHATVTFTPDFNQLSNIKGATACRAIDVWENEDFDLRKDRSFEIEPRDSLFLIIYDCKQFSSPPTMKPSTAPVVQTKSPLPLPSRKPPRGRGRKKKKQSKKL